MKKGTLTRLLTIPWWVMLFGVIRVADIHPERFTSLGQMVMLLLTVGMCVIMIPAAFWAAHESDLQDQEVVKLRRQVRK